MSRLGKLPVTIPAGVTVTLEGSELKVKGPKGELSRPVKEKHVDIKIDGDTITLEPKKTPEAPAMWGTYAAHLRNMITGVTDGFTKVLEIEGVGYRAEVKGSDLVLNVGYSHQVPMPIPDGVQATVEKNVITLTGFNNEILGQYAADVRDVRPPEPYKGKGIRYQGEQITRKQGKKAV